MNTFLDLEKNHITIFYKNAGRIFFQKQQNSRNDKTTPFKRAWRFMFGCSDKPSKSNVCVPFRVLYSFTSLPWTLFCSAEFSMRHKITAHLLFCTITQEFSQFLYWSYFKLLHIWWILVEGKVEDNH